MSFPADAQLRVPAQTAYVSVLRMTAAGLAARLDLTIDDIEDLRMSVGEACALLLDPDRGTHLVVDFRLEPGCLSVTATVDAPGDIDRESFGWQVLSSLATGLSAETNDDQRSVTFTINSTGPESRDGGQ